MQAFTQPEALQTHLSQLRLEGKRIGFVPTMGALHDGHITLVREARKKCDIVVSSIYVNPTQFNESADFENYPKDLDTDKEMLREAGCDVLFFPNDNIMYPTRPVLSISFGDLETSMEGRFRPGHFAGVGLIVSKLLHLVMPDMAFFGQKDLQQFAVIRQLVHDLFFPVTLVRVSTVREDDGLAMSSRNRRLSDEQRKEAPKLYAALQTVREKLLAGSSAIDACAGAKASLNESLIDLEYLEVVNANTLQTANKKQPGEELAVCIAGYLGEIRLIDNIIV